MANVLLFNDEYDKAFLGLHMATLAEVVPAVHVYSPRTYFFRSKK